MAFWMQLVWSSHRLGHRSNSKQRISSIAASKTAAKLPVQDGDVDDTSTFDLFRFGAIGDVTQIAKVVDGNYQRGDYSSSAERRTILLGGACFRTSDYGPRRALAS